jgi:hypothetical protein
VKDFTKRHGLALAVISALTLFYLLGVAAVPFHPDEASLLFQSRDLEAWVTRPQDLAWRPNAANDPKGYRALNAPLAKYVLGIGRRMAGYGPDSVATDWDWSLSWQANAAAGALPPPRLLLGARLASSCLILLTLVFIYLSGIVIDGRATGLVAAIFIGTNALVLLHTRRAMAEGTLLMTVSLAVWTLLEIRRRPGWAGAGGALAFAAKQSTAPLILVGVVASLWPKSLTWKGMRWKQGLAYLAAGALVAVILQPFFWAHPLGAARAMWEARQSLLASQVESVAGVAPDRLLLDPAARAAGIIGEVFIIPPQISEVGNYRQETAEQERAYLANPLNSLARRTSGGSIVLGLTLVGLITSLWPRKDSSQAHLDSRKWLAAAGLLQVAAVGIANPLPVQRYYVPLIPFVALWFAYGAVGFIRVLPWHALSRLRTATP